MIKNIRKFILGKKCRNIENGEITKEELQKLQKERAMIIDVRSPMEYKEEHINGAINIPLYDLRSKAKELLKDTRQPIIVYCSTGARSKKAKNELLKQGYINIYNLYEGF